MVELAVGTLGRTERDYASSGRAETSLDYWRVGPGGEKAEIDHWAEAINAGRLAETWHVLADGERVLAGRKPVGVRRNSYAGRCCDCGALVAPDCGELLKVGGAWKTRCATCFAGRA